MDATWKCPQCGAWWAFEKTCTECWGKSLDDSAKPAQTPIERSGFFRGAKISKQQSANRGPKS